MPELFSLCIIEDRDNPLPEETEEDQACQQKIKEACDKFRATLVAIEEEYQAGLFDAETREEIAEYVFG